MGISEQIEGSSDWGRYPNLTPDLNISTYTVHPHMNMYTHIHIHPQSMLITGNCEKVWAGEQQE